jgi:LmbE family N-acetylglucosaminyl deacetylase
MKAMVMVAHPDDCVIFAYSYLHHHADYQWTVCYLTYTDQDPRGKEMQQFWQRRGIATTFLGFPDVWNQELNCPGDVDARAATMAIHAVIADQDLVVTHNENGEYGHPHHVLVHQATQHHAHRVLFAPAGQGTVKYSIESGHYDLAELPLHRDVIEGFHSQHHTNEYIICKNT